MIMPTPTLGDLVTSMLTPSQFAKEAQDPPAFDPQVSKWLCLTDPCACDKDISLSQLGRIYNINRAPSLIDHFLRGIGPGRNPGDLQGDALQGHGHMLTEAAASTAHSGPATAPPHGLANGGFTHAVISTRAVPTDVGFGAPRFENETRPKNVAVHIYLCVNSR